MNKIILIGFATSYKTTVGRLLAEKLQYLFVDTDAEIARRNNLTIKQIFDTYGEKYFRAKESQLLTELAQSKQTVVACGGGTVLSGNFAEFVANNVVVWLTVTAQTVLSRLGDTQRPLFDGLTVEQIDDYISARNPIYGKFAHFKINTDGKSADEVAQQILSLI